MFSIVEFVNLGMLQWQKEISVRIKVEQKIR